MHHQDGSWHEMKGGDGQPDCSCCLGADCEQGMGSQSGSHLLGTDSKQGMDRRSAADLWVHIAQGLPLPSACLPNRREGQTPIIAAFQT